MDLSNQIVKRERKLQPVWLKIIALLIFWGLFFIISNPMSQERIAQYGKSTEGINNAARRGVSPNITSGLTISQAIIPRGDHWVGFDVFFGTYSRVNNSRFSISLLNSEGSEIYQATIDAQLLADNSYFHVDIPDQTKLSGDRYELIVTGIDGEVETSPSIWVKDVADVEAACVNGEQTDYVLDVLLSYDNRWVYPTVFMAIVLLSFVFVCLAKKPDERAFLLFCLLLSALFVIITPFRHPLDEDTHFLKSYAISRLNLSEDTVDGKVGFLLPSSVNDSVSYRNFGLNKNTGLLSTSTDSEIGFIDNHYSSSIIPINHSVAAVGLAIARLLHLSVGLTIWFGRLANYLFYVIVCYFAIKNAKYYKSLFFVVATLPAALWMAASYSTDPVLLSTSLLFVSICLKYFLSDESTKITKLDLAALLCCGACIASVKYFIYLPIATCFYMIPKRCFEKHQRRNMVFAAVAVMVVLAAWQYILMKRFPFIEDRNGNVSVMEQIKFVFGNLGFAIRNFADYFLSNIVWHLENSFYDTVMPNVSSALGMLAILSAVVARDKCPVNRIQKLHAVRLHFVLIFLVVSLLVMASLYVGFTQVGQYGIDGVQPRYFQPVMIFLMLPMAMTRIKNGEKGHDSILLMIVECSLLLSMTGTLMNAMMP